MHWICCGCIALRLIFFEFFLYRLWIANMWCIFFLVVSGFDPSGKMVTNRSDPTQVAQVQYDFFGIRIIWPDCGHWYFVAASWHGQKWGWVHWFTVSWDIYSIRSKEKVILIRGHSLQHAQFAWENLHRSCWWKIQKKQQFSSPQNVDALNAICTTSLKRVVTSFWCFGFSAFSAYKNFQRIW